MENTITMRNAADVLLEIQRITFEYGGKVNKDTLDKMLVGVIEDYLEEFTQHVDYEGLLTCQQKLAEFELNERYE